MLAHQSNQTRCAWVPFARRLAVIASADDGHLDAHDARALYLVAAAADWQLEEPTIRAASGAKTGAQADIQPGTRSC